MDRRDVLIEWKNRFDAAVEAAGQVFYEWHPETGHVMLRGPVRQIFGWTEETEPTTLETWVAIVHPDDRERFLAECTRCEREHAAFRMEYRVRTAGGESLWIEDRGNHMVDVNGRTRVLGFVQDITPRVTIEEEQRRRNECSIRQRNALAQISALDLTDGTAALRTILTVLSETLEIERVSFWLLQNGPESIECQHMLERTADRWSSGAVLMGKDFPAYFEAMRAGTIIAANDAVTDPRTSEFADCYLAPNRIRAMLDVPVWEDGRVAGVVCSEHVGDAPREWTLDEQEFALAIANVVSRLLAARHRKRMETQLLVADRMASMGVLVAGVAHEINNPLGFLLASIVYLSDTVKQVRAGKERVEGEVLDEVESALGDAVEGARRVRNIVADLRMFSRQQEESTLVDVNKPVEAAVRMAYAETKGLLEVQVDLAETAEVLASESRLGQVMLNLIINAAQAMPPRPKEQNRIRVSTSRAGDRVLIEVADNGTGIPPDVRARIFDPFFTTKEVGKGTGLGLSICHSIVTGFGGEITVESQPGVGSTFRISLPSATSVGLASEAA